MLTHERSTEPTANPGRTDIPFLTGQDYAEREYRRFGCPSHVLPSQRPGVNPHADDVRVKTEPGLEIGSTEEAEAGCKERFWRVYDIRRHLNAVHGLQLEASEVKELLVQAGEHL